MSSNKKSLGTVLILLLLFVGIGVAGWAYFSKNKSSMPPLTQAEETQEGMTPLEGTDPALEDTSLGKKGTIHKLSINPALGRRAAGDPNAPITVHEFFSLSCNHCADFNKNVYPAFKEKYIDSGKVYFIYEEFPLNGPALYGSMIARCLPEERYVGFIDLLFDNQDKWAFGGDFKATLQQNAKLAGMSDEEFETCFNNKDLQKAVASNIKEASDVWAISSTPTFVFNDGALILSGSHSLEKFDAAITELSGGESAATPQNGDLPAPDLNVDETQREIWKDMESGEYPPTPEVQDDGMPNPDAETAPSETPSTMNPESDSGMESPETDTDAGMDSPATPMEEMPETPETIDDTTIQ